MKIKINTKKIKALNPCKYRFENWLKHYKNWSGDILEFLALPDEIVMVDDKLWVVLRLVPQDIREYFAFDMAVDAAYAAAYATYAADAAYYAAYAAARAAHCAAADTDADAAAYAAAAALYAADAAIATHYDDDAAYAAWERQRQKALDTLAYLIATHKRR